MRVLAVVAAVVAVVSVGMFGFYVGRDLAVASIWVVSAFGWTCAALNMVRS